MPVAKKRRAFLITPAEAVEVATGSPRSRRQRPRSGRTPLRSRAGGGNRREDGLGRATRSRSPTGRTPRAMVNVAGPNLPSITQRAAADAAAHSARAGRKLVGLRVILVRLEVLTKARESASRALLRAIVVVRDISRDGCREASRVKLMTRQARNLTTESPRNVRRPRSAEWTDANHLAVGRPQPASSGWPIAKWYTGVAIRPALAAIASGWAHRWAHRVRSGPECRVSCCRARSSVG